MLLSRLSSNFFSGQEAETLNGKDVRNTTPGIGAPESNLACPVPRTRVAAVSDA